VARCRAKLAQHQPFCLQGENVVEPSLAALRRTLAKSSLAKVDGKPVFSKYSFPASLPETSEKLS
jgi:hypothetical protein